MAYIGNEPVIGQWRKLTDISSGFNGVTTTFTLSVPPGTSQYYVTPGSASQLLISLGGIIQEPDVDYTVSLSTITFTTPPTLGLNFFGILCGDALNAGVPSDGTIIDAKVASNAAINSTKLKFNQSGVGAVERTVDNKLKDIVSVKDFGAVGDGVADDTVAFTNARLAAASTGNPLLVPQGNYLVSGTVYNSSGGLVYLNDGFTSGVNLGSASQNNQVLVVAETPNTSPIDSTASRVPISVTVVGNGANHASGVRSNLLNKSTDGDGCTGFYGRATNYSNANWGAAVHGETRHNGGTSIGLNSENAGYSTSGAMIGVNVHNTTGTTDLHPEDSSISDESPATSKAIQILGGATDPGLWAYGLYFSANSIKSTGIAIDLQCAAAYGISFRGATLSTAAIALKDTQQIKFEASNVIALGYNSAAAGGAALEFVNGANVNLRMYNSGICDFRGDIRPSADNTNKLGAATRRFTEVHSLKYVFDGSGNTGIQYGANSPEGVVTAGIGSLYLRTNGGAGTTLYVKESGTGNTGWVAK